MNIEQIIEDGLIEPTKEDFETYGHGSNIMYDKEAYEKAIKLYIQKKELIQSFLNKVNHADQLAEALREVSITFKDKATEYQKIQFEQPDRIEYYEGLSEGYQECYKVLQTALANYESLNKAKMKNIPQRIFLSFDPELNKTNDFNKLDTEFVLWGSKREDETDIEYVHLDSLKSNPSEFGMIKDEEDLVPLKTLQHCKQSLKLEHNENVRLSKELADKKHQADQLADALRGCVKAMAGGEEMSISETIDAFKNGLQTLTNYESLNKVK